MWETRLNIQPLLWLCACGTAGEVGPENLPSFSITNCQLQTRWPWNFLDILKILALSDYLFPH